MIVIQEIKQKEPNFLNRIVPHILYGACRRCNLDDNLYNYYWVEGNIVNVSCVCALCYGKLAKNSERLDANFKIYGCDYDSNVCEGCGTVAELVKHHYIIGKDIYIKHLCRGCNIALAYDKIVGLSWDKQLNILLISRLKAFKKVCRDPVLKKVLAGI